MRYRYVTGRPAKAYWDDEWREASTKSLTVHEPREDEPQKTGLLDQNGTPLYRVRQAEPVGFLARRVKC